MGEFTKSLVIIHNNERAWKLIVVMQCFNTVAPKYNIFWVKFTARLLSKCQSLI